MATTSDYLNQLQTDKQNLVNNLVEKGVEATNDETFTTLVPKVSNIVSGGGEVSEYFTEELQKYNSFGSNIVSGWQMSILKLPKFKFFGNNLESAFARYHLDSLDLSNFDTSKVTTMKNMFFNCSLLTNLDLSNFDTSNVYYMNHMFDSCYKLMSLDLSSFNTSNVTDMSDMFNGCSKLANLDISNFDMDKVVSVNNMFYNGLKNLKMGVKLGRGYTQKSSNYYSYTCRLDKSTKLSHESLMDVINKLYDLNLTYDVANGGILYSQKLQLGQTNVAKLTPEEIAIATNKGWTVS